MTDTRNRHISQIQGDKTVDKIVELLDPRCLGHWSDLDDYHYTIIAAAFTLRGKGLTDWIYQTQWSAGSTLWASPTGNGTLTVDHNGRLS
jgi:hypothetical protein